MLTLTTLASGSSGNCTLVSDGHTHLLVDAGISARRITTALKAMDIDPKTLAGVLITHEHSDHISGLATLTKQLPFPLYASAGTARALLDKLPALTEDRVRAFIPGDTFEIGALGVETFPTPHDAAQSTGYALTDGGRKAAVVTDLGHVTPEVEEGIRGAHLLVAETNHDPEWLRSGDYPYFLKERILGSRGHLSNEDGARLICAAARQGVRTVVLAHLSKDNNTPQRAYDTVAMALMRQGAELDRDVVLDVAPRAAAGRRYTV
ncbi:MBL fold metallo-hydrolase [Pseudoflavonifractor phocaeensis]|uniref:MBL fold metallo-hydrolase n=1 Tax=Pseudoflavonifractor phocaeensis TaxID=1870988 RepID=UPI00195CE11C|nr:MBL fold metallo-hydrolase [Pseudoflavonifractor phocaeensis]